MLLLLLVGVLPVRAVSVVPPDFSQLVNEATQIVRVRITEIATRWDETPHGKVIHTYVSGETLKTIKGVAEARVQLRFFGGTVGTTTMEVSDMPVFEVGQTYILFIAGNGRVFCPLVGVMHGSYLVLTDTSSGEEYVARSNRQPLAGVDDVALPVITQASHPALRLSTGKGLTPSAFETAISQELKRGGAY